MFRAERLFGCGCCHEAIILDSAFFHINGPLTLQTHLDVLTVEVAANMTLVQLDEPFLFVLSRLIVLDKPLTNLLLAETAVVIGVKHLNRAIDLFVRDLLRLTFRHSSHCFLLECKDSANELISFLSLELTRLRFVIMAPHGVDEAGQHVLGQVLGIAVEASDDLGGICSLLIRPVHKYAVNDAGHIGGLDVFHAITARFSGMSHKLFERPCIIIFRVFFVHKFTSHRDQKE